MSDDGLTEADRQVVHALFGGGPNPYAALDRLLAKPRAAQRKMLRLEVWCENNKCTPVRVFALRDGLLVQCRSDANIEGLRDQYPHLTEWSRRRAFFLSEWQDLRPEVRAESHLQVVCNCNQTTPRLVDVQRVLDLIPADGERTRRVALAQVSPTSA